MIKVLLLILILLSAPFMAFANTGTYCLSSGRLEGYSCDAAIDRADAWFSVQMLQQSGVPAVPEAQLVYRSQLDDGRALIYVGKFEGEQSGAQALEEALKRWGAHARPLLVEFTPRDDFPQIRLIAEPNPHVLAQVGGAVALSAQPTPLLETQTVISDQPAEKAVAPVNMVSADKPAVMVEKPQYSLVYSIQVGAFAQVEYGQAFASKNRDVPLYCRQKENGIFAVYYGVYQGYSDAKPHLGDYALFDKMGAYVVKLKNVSFQPCDALAESIREAKRKAYAPCQDCEASSIAEGFLPDQKKLMGQ